MTIPSDRLHHVLCAERFAWCLQGVPHLPCRAAEGEHAVATDDLIAATGIISHEFQRSPECSCHCEVSLVKVRDGDRIDVVDHPPGADQAEPFQTERRRYGTGRSSGSADAQEAPAKPVQAASEP